jgi:outer membrane protein OmpU
LINQNNKKDKTMINFKKIGLTALTGSLVAFSANAVEFGVAGGVELTLTDTGGNRGSEVTGNQFGANSALTFSASGDVGFGTVSATRALLDSAGVSGGISTSHQSLDMGDMGTLSFDGKGGALVGLTANDDVLPTAYEEMWTGVGSGDGIGGVGSTNVIGYQNTFSGVTVSAGYSNGIGATTTAESGASGAGADGSKRDLYISSSVVDGITVGAGIGQSTAGNNNTTDADTEELVAHVVYSSGPISAGLRMGATDGGAEGTASTEIMGYSVAFNVNENFAISYGIQEVEKVALGATAAVTEKVTGISAAYTIGAASIRFHRSEADNAAYVKGTDDEHMELGVVLAF